MHNYFQDEINKTTEIKNYYLTFTVSGVNFGLDINNVQMIIQKPQISYFPDLPFYIIGVFKYGNHIYPIMDMSRRFRLSKGNNADRSPVILIKVTDMYIGMLVEDVIEVIQPNNNMKVDVPAEKTGFYSRFVGDIIKKDNILIFTINCDTLFVNEKEYIEEINYSNKG